MAASLGRRLELKMSVLYRYSRKAIKDIRHIKVSRWLSTCFASLFYLTFTSTLRWQITMTLLFLEMKQYICCFCTKHDETCTWTFMAIAASGVFLIFTGVRKTSVFLFELGEAQSAPVPDNRGPRKAVFYRVNVQCIIFQKQVMPFKC